MDGLDIKKSYLFTAEPTYECPRVGRVDGRIEIRKMLEGLEDKRVLIVLPKQMMLMRGESWYPSGLFASDGDFNRIGLRNPELRSSGPVRLYVNPERLSMTGEMYVDLGWDVVIVPYPDTVGSKESKKFGTLAKIKKTGAAFRISSRYWQASTPDKMRSVLHLVTGEPTNRLRRELMTRQASPGYQPNWAGWRPVSNWKTIVSDLLEPHRVFYTVRFDSEGEPIYG